MDSMNTDYSTGFSLIEEDICGNNICDKYESADYCPEDCDSICGDNFVTHGEECEVNFHCEIGSTCNGCSCI